MTCMLWYSSHLWSCHRLVGEDVAAWHGRECPRFQGIGRLSGRNCSPRLVLRHKLGYCRAAKEILSSHTKRTSDRVEYSSIEFFDKIAKAFVSMRFSTLRQPLLETGWRSNIPISYTLSTSASQQVGFTPT
ncbi:hypothetical protein P154DRAFT_329019 [Amniculicola lignicola CBS 123094]|uniref:Uncharacterized protein n=1 Tax=Amniculicola lignicola CBS 123094 TaxID=1392246 RepID=A0A6A5WE80_9PLEO|nr:hypothetical protein P154DRAFT_329019 [Amniculicola lignicola CBS 123094]